MVALAGVAAEPGVVAVAEVVAVAGVAAEAGVVAVAGVAVAEVEAAPLLVEGAAVAFFLEEDVPYFLEEEVPFFLEEDAFFFFDGGGVSSPWKVWAAAEPTSTSGRTSARDRSERNMSASPR
jgi:hypothetical protein